MAEVLAKSYVDKQRRELELRVKKQQKRAAREFGFAREEKKKVISNSKKSSEIDSASSFNSIVKSDTTNSDKSDDFEPFDYYAEKDPMEVKKASDERKVQALRKKVRRMTDLKRNEMAALSSSKHMETIAENNETYTSPKKPDLKNKDEKV